MTRHSALLGGIAAALLMTVSAVPALAQSPASALSPADAALTPEDAATLGAGKYVWRPELASDGSVQVVVDLGTQLAYVYRGATLIGISTVSTGRDGYETPVGAFTILQKQVTHRSNRYNNAPMPYMQRLTWDGVALHAGGVPGYRESHGCVHLPVAFAKALYGLTDVGATVEIAEGTTIDNGVVTPDTPLAPVGTPEVVADEAQPATTAAAAPTGGNVSLASYSVRGN